MADPVSTAPKHVIRRRALAAVDVLASALFGTPVLGATALVLLVRRPPRRSGRALLVLDTCYSVQMIRERQLERTVVARDLDGFFDHVWSVHPLVGASPEHRRDESTGPPRSTGLAERHTVIEGRVGRYPWLAHLPVLNLILAQCGLVLRLDRLVRREEVVAVTAGDPFYIGLLGWALARANRTPLTVTIVANYDAIHEQTRRPIYPRLLRSRWVENRVQRFVLSRADSVGVGSRDNLEYALANGAREDRIAHYEIGDLIEPVHFAQPGLRSPVRPELGLTCRPFLLAVSRLVPLKHPGDVLGVLARARERVPDLAGVIVGDGELREELEAEARALGLEEDVVFTGNRDQAWIARAMTDATVVVSTITGRALIEAALSGTPVVAYDVEWQPEFVIHGQTGVIVPYRDTTAMAAAVVELVSDPRRAARLGGRGRARALEVMDPAKNMAAKRAQYEALLDRWRRKGRRSSRLLGAGPGRLTHDAGEIRQITPAG